MYSILFSSGHAASDGGAPWALALHPFDSHEEAAAYLREHARSYVWGGPNPTCVIVPTAEVESEAQRRGWRLVSAS